MENQDPLKKLQDQMKKLIGTDSTVKRRKRTKEDAQREIFLTTIPLLEHILTRGVMLESDYGFNTSTYDEPFYQIIDSLIYLHFDEDAADLIMFFS
jgi:SAM-dependent MidA family methyltransferase